MNINEFLEIIVESNDLRVGKKFKIDSTQYEIIHCLKSKCKVKILNGKNMDDELYMFNGQIKNACK